MFLDTTTDARFTERLRRHYRMVKDAVNDPAHRVHLLLQEGHMGTIRRDQPRTGRNDPCPCGSSRKFKRCCSGEAPRGLSG